ncbi:OmpA family protein [Psychrobacter pacificensis]|nr:OmpA family protein [Psychrobacter pacificensis]MBZ1393145.1 OmpA family protein [Psychrobacter pacificensis]MDE0843472.1 OmpA family protein [Psychrobacter pacificensis]
MKSLHLNKITGLSLISLTMLAMTGCVGTKYLSEGITDEGHVEPENISFPELEDAWQTEGQFPNSENLSKIKPGIAKDELYQLIGRPHFSEAQHAREWDYIMKFYQPDNSVKICQYKVIFDTDFKGQEFYWKPADCPPQKPVVVPAQPPSAPIVTVAPAPLKERINLGADALFKFDKWQPENILPQGRAELDALATKLREYQTMGDARIVITGHTDRKGDDMYNMNLSQLRAQTVRAYLVNQGVNPSSMLAVGAGESQPVKECSTNLTRQQEIDCLQPNRRVTLDVIVTQ